MQGVENFMEIASRYCAFVEGSDALDRSALVRELETHLVSLYGAALLLSEPDDVSDTDAPDSMTADEWKALEQRLSEKLGDLDYYQVMFDPYAYDEAPVTGSLADDMADIYRDLRDGFAVIETGGTLGDAVWEWRFGFDNHWGCHAAYALYAVHALAHPGGARSVDRAG